MTFLTPLLAGIAAAIAIPALVILYFLKLRRRDMEISTTLLWKKAIQDLQANAPFQRLRRNILLLLQLLILAALLFGLAQPQIAGQIVEGQRHVILIDRSASMQSLDGGSDSRSRLDEAKAQAVAFVDSLREGGLGGLLDRGSADEAMIIAFDGGSEVRQPFTSDKNLLRAAINAIEPVDAVTRLKPAMDLARAHLPRRQHLDRDGRILDVEGLTQGGVTIHLYSDGAFPDTAEAIAGPEDTIIFRRVGTPQAGNTGIIGLRAERAFDNPARLSLFVGLQNNEPTPRTVDVELLIDGVVSGLRSVTIPGAAAPTTAAAATPDAPAPTSAPASTPGTNGVVFTLDRAQGALVQVNLRSPGSSERPQGDLLPVDDLAWLWVPPAKRLAVATVTTGNLFIRAALDGLPLARNDALTPTQFESLLRENKIGDYDVVILDGWLPPGATPEGPGLPPGRWIVLNAVPGGTSGITDKGKGPAAGIVDWSRDHPALRNVNLDPLVISESRLVELADAGPARAIASSDRGPAVIELQTADVRALVVPFDLAASNWPFDLSFVIFLAQSIQFVGGELATLAEGRGIQPGEVLRDRLPLGAADATLISPGAARNHLTLAPDASFAFGPITRAGVYRAEWTGPAASGDLPDGSSATRVYTANLHDALESDIRAPERLELASREVQAQASTSSQADRRLWPYLLLAALAILLLEWYIYNRKVHV